ncbi:MAG: PBP1A family penicillin-binding protein [Bacteroidota bacterium]
MSAPFLTERPPDSPGPSKRRRPRWLRVLGVVVACSVLASGVGLLVLFGYGNHVASTYPSPMDVKRTSLELPSIVYMADGTELARYFVKNRVWVPLDSVSQHVVDALIATEDHRYFEHGGIDYRRLVSAAFKTARGERQGASTIVMQLVRNLYPEVRELGDLQRKAHELALAQHIDRSYSKESLLELYLNTVFFGQRAYGIEAAARTYFSVPASQLDVAQSALLIAMLKGPSLYHPIERPELATRRRNLVLDRMLTHGYISEAEAKQFQRTGLGLNLAGEMRSPSPAPYFAEHVRTWAEDWARTNGYDLHKDGLRIYTTLDPDIQQAAEKAVDAQMAGLQAVVDYEWSRSGTRRLGEETSDYLRRPTNGRRLAYFWKQHPDVLADHIRRADAYREALVQGEGAEAAINRLLETPSFIDALCETLGTLQAGLVSIDPRTGHIKAWVGGRDFDSDRYDKVALARRQPGSTFKPFAYAAAIDAGYSSYDVLRDSVQTYTAGREDHWVPTNSTGISSDELVSLRTALAQSKNTVTAQVVQRVGPSQIARYARRLGVESPLRPVLSIGLGTSEVTLLELTNAYTSIAAQGVHREPVFVTKITDRTGRVLETFGSDPERALSHRTSSILVDMLRGVIDDGTGRRVKWQFGLDRFDLAGKTGTTQNNADGWFMLMHPDLVTGVWLGFNDQRLRFRSNWWGQGGHNALLVAGDYYQALHTAGHLNPTRTFGEPGLEVIPTKPAAHSTTLPDSTLSPNSTIPTDPSISTTPQPSTP